MKQKSFKKIQQITNFIWVSTDGAGTAFTDKINRIFHMLNNITGLYLDMEPGAEWMCEWA